MVEERLKHYEAILKKKGIDLYQAAGASEADDARKSGPPEESKTVWQMPTPASDASGASGSQATIFDPRLVQGKSGTKLADK